MKKQSTRTVLVVLVVLASLVSYIYLNTVELTAAEETPVEYQLEEEKTQEEARTQTNLRLPDVALIKKVIETGKSLIPGS